MSPRLTDLRGLPEDVQVPGYDRTTHGTGIVHLGLGAFHKAHQAVYTDDALGAEGGDWRIIGVSLRSTGPSEELMPQGGLYTVIERSVDGTHARVVGALDSAFALRQEPDAVEAALRDPATKIVSLTVTEKGYGIDRATGGVDRRHPAIAADLADPQNPQGVAGLLVRALGQRRTDGTPPFTVLCCDNLPENGRMLCGLLIDFARQVAPELSEHIAQEVAFPCTMVDRITPARGPATLDLAERLIGRRDEAAIEAEAFRQWIIEDDFPAGRPAWDAGGAIFVEDVRPYEEMKLRMLNGAHSMLAYTGFLLGHTFVRDVMNDPDLVPLIKRHIAAAAGTLPPVPGVDLDSYARDLSARFANPHLEHATYQIAMDGSEKLPQRVWAPACDARQKGLPLDAFAFATAAWIRYAFGRTEAGEAYDLRDPREAALRSALDGTDTAESALARLADLEHLMPEELGADAQWLRAVAVRLDTMMSRGMRSSVKRELQAS